MFKFFGKIKGRVKKRTCGNGNIVYYPQVKRFLFWRYLLHSYYSGKFFEDTTLWIHDFGVMVTYDFDDAKQFKTSYITGYNSKTKPKNEYIYD